MRIVFRVDSSEVIGSGHVMRCLALANALRHVGTETLFVSASLPAPLRERVVGSRHSVVEIRPGEWLERLGRDWETAKLSSLEAIADVEGTVVAAGGRSEWLVVDHYLLEHEWEAQARSVAERILVIDDLADRPHDCDLLLDQTFGRDESDYHPLIPSAARLLCGSEFALLRPEFTRERPRALERRRHAGPVRRILVSLGGMDVGGLTGPVVDTVLDAAPGCEIDVVMSEAASTLDQLRQIAAEHARVSLHVGSNHVAQLMCGADLAIGAAGTSSYERCCLGLPSITLALAKNQRFIASQLERAGAHLFAKSVDDCAAGLGRLIEDSAARVRMSEAAAAVTDGGGAERVIEAMMRR